MENQDTGSSNNVESNLEHSKDTKLVDSNTLNGVNGTVVHDKTNNVDSVQLSQPALSNSAAGQQEEHRSSPVIPNGTDSQSEHQSAPFHSNELKGEGASLTKQETVNHVEEIVAGDNDANKMLTEVSSNGNSCEVKQSAMSNDVEKNQGLLSDKQPSQEGNSHQTLSSNSSDTTESHSRSNLNTSQTTKSSQHLPSSEFPDRIKDSKKATDSEPPSKEVPQTNEQTDNLPHSHASPSHAGDTTASALSHDEPNKDTKTVASSHGLDSHTKDKLPNTTSGSASVPSSMPHLQMPHHDKNNPHLIPIPSLPNSMMNPAMAAGGMNMFPPHMMNPYFMMSDPRFAAAFQQQMFRGMPPFNLRFPPQQPATRGSRPRGPRGPRQNKSQQQHQSLPPEAMHHKNRPPPLDSSHLKIDPLQDSIPSLPGGSSKDHSNEPNPSSSSRSSTPRSQTSLASPVTTQPEGATHSDIMPQQPPPAHFHGKIEIPPLPPGMMPPAHSHGKTELPPGAVPIAHSHGKTDLPPHLLGTVSHSQGQRGLPSHLTESLPPLAHSTQASTAVKTNVPLASQKETVPVSSASISDSNVPSHSETSQTTNITTTTAASSVDVTFSPSLSTSKTVNLTSQHEPASSSSLDNVQQGNSSTAVTCPSTNPVSSHVNSITNVTTAGSETELISAQTSVTNSAGVPSTSHIPMCDSSALKETPSITKQSTSSSMSSLESPSVAVSTSISDGSCPVTVKPSTVSESQVSSAVPSATTVPQMTSAPAHFSPMGPMHPAMAPHFMKQKGRGQRMPGKQRGAAPEMPPGIPPGMMPPFGRFPHFMSPQIARMAMSPEMMALAQKMVNSGPSVSEGESGSGPQMPKLDPNQLELLRNMNMRMRPPFGMRPGMPPFPRNMPPPPRYPGLSMALPTGSEGLPLRLPGTQPPSSTSGSTALTSPTPSGRSASESQSPHQSASPVAPSASPHSSVTGMGDKTPSPVPRSPANSDTTSVGSTPIKQEPIEQRISACEFIFCLL